MKYRLSPAKVRLDGQGAESRRRIETGTEALFAAVLGFMSLLLFAQAYQEIPQLAGASWLLRVLSWVFAAVFGFLVIVRGYVARYSWLATLDFRVARAAQDIPFLLLRWMVLVTFVLIIDLISIKATPLYAILNLLLAGFILVIPL